ncbi:MAG: ribonuclease III [Planctomycetota bacterium]
MDERVRETERLLGVTFEDKELLALSLTHASFTDSRVESNERLEFLGDAVLGMIVCERVFERYPDLLEGEMTKIKSLAVSRKTCAEIAGEIGLDRLLATGKGMAAHAALPRSVSAAVLESVIGALYTDRGYDACRAWLLPLLDPVIDGAAESDHQSNYKSLLQQHAQQTEGEPPTYLVLDEKGPDHAKAFRVAVAMGGRTYEPCWGNSKKQAEQRAAMHALAELGVIDVIEKATPAG